MKKFMMILACLVALFSYVGYKVYLALDIGKPFDLFNHETCKRISNISGIEDITMYDDVAIGSSGDIFELIFRNNLDIENGGLVVIDPQKQTAETLELTGFPKDIAFHPHGIYLYEKRLLYVINHAFKNGGERVEVFAVSKTPKVTVTYLRTIQFPTTEMGRLNDLVVMEEDAFYVTQWLPEAADINTGKAEGLVAHLKDVFSYIFLEKTGIHYCINNNGQSSCLEQIVTSSYFNGINTDGNDIFAVDLVQKQVKRYWINEDHTLTELEVIDTYRSIDNIEYDPNTKRFYGGSISNSQKIMENQELAKAANGWKNLDRSEIVNPGGVVEIYQDAKEVWKSREILMQNELFGVSATVRTGEKIILGSFFDEGVVFCKPKF